MFLVGLMLIVAYMDLREISFLWTLIAVGIVIMILSIVMLGLIYSGIKEEINKNEDNK